MKILKGRSRTTAVALTVTLLCAACGEDHGLRTVRGKVLYKGQPAKGANIIFHREAAAPSTPGQEAPPIASGVVDEQGEFSLTSGDWGRGALPGKYRVLVVWPDIEAFAMLDEAAKTKLETKYGRDMARIPKDKLKGRYGKAEKPLLFAEVKPETNDLSPFDLTD